jgi:hypothetical protein
VIFSVPVLVVLIFVVENYWLAGGYLALIAMAVFLLFRKRS